MNEMFKASERFTFGNSHKNWPGSFYGKENKHPRFVFCVITVKITVLPKLLVELSSIRANDCIFHRK